ncbi:MurR/RpiR family transcriptional regulator [Mycoplasmopsis lipofaciens]|uniref:hypothetical protein n=1 Tax=Mycoplasmopsis lipofaciens TaxID=114884 RepID=UPI0004822CA9|nr:hypothetical protein [Mycoplasmopsis lipofaciens]
MKTTNNLISTSSYISNLIVISKEGSNTNKYISEKLLLYIKNKIKLSKAINFCQEIGVSPAAITILSKKIGLKNVKELIFVHNNSLILKEEDKDLEDSIYSKIASLINISEKIFFIGVSGAIGVNLDFQIKLLRMNKNAILLMNKYEQIGISKLLTEKDTIILNSVSLQHKWMIDIIKNTKANVVLLSSWLPKNIKNKVTYFLKIKDNERHDGLRLYTMEGRVTTSRMFFHIFKKLQENSDNYKNLQLTSYR